MMDCPDCHGIGWVEEFDPLRPASDDDGHVLIPCECGDWPAPVDDLLEYDACPW